MRRIFIIVLILATGCATVRPHENVAPTSLPTTVIEHGAVLDTNNEELRSDRPSPSVAIPSISDDASPQIAQEPTEPSAGEKFTSVPASTSAVLNKKSSKSYNQSQTIPVPDYKLHSLVELAAKNDEKIMNVFLGMYRKTVEGIMGTANNPYKHQSIVGANGQTYEVFFYLTHEPRKGKPISDRMLTPVIFKQGRVAGIGTYQLRKLIRTGSLDRQKNAQGISSAASADKSPS